MTIAALKRRLQPGTRVNLVKAYWMGPDHPPIERVVEKVNSVDIIFAPSAFSKGKQSHLRIPKASELTETATGFIVRYADETSSKYDLVYEWAA